MGRKCPKSKWYFIFPDKRAVSGDLCAYDQSEMESGKRRKDRTAFTYSYEDLNHLGATPYDSVTQESGGDDAPTYPLSRRGRYAQISRHNAQPNAKLDEYAMCVSPESLSLICDSGAFNATRYTPILNREDYFDEHMGDNTTKPEADDGRMARRGEICASPELSQLSLSMWEMFVVDIPSINMGSIWPIRRVIFRAFHISLVVVLISPRCTISTTYYDTPKFTNKSSRRKIRPL